MYKSRFCIWFWMSRKLVKKLLTSKLGSAILMVSRKLGINCDRRIIMDKERILEKSRKENKNQDEMERQIRIEG